MNERAAERSLRDLMGLLALPALWAGRDGATVLQILTQAIERIVSPDMSYVDVPMLREEPPSRELRLKGRVLSEEHLMGWRDAIDHLQQMPIGAAPVSQVTPTGRLQVVRLSMGYSSRDGSMWFGSADSEFPSVTQLAFLRAATSLGATGLQAARIMHELEQASRAKDEFLAMLGHELRNPLAPIVTSLELIKQRSASPLDREHALIERQVNHLRRLVDDLLDVSRITSGKIQLTKEALQIKSVLFRAIEEVSPLLEQRRHKLVVDLPAEGAWISGDSTRLTQVFANLLTNAAKYTDLDGKISVTAAVEGGKMIHIHVRDNGVGISEELAPRLFSIFEQGRTSIDRSRGGLGIGLAIVKIFVELHGGTVKAISAGKGLGSDFEVSLPLISDQVGRANPTMAESSGHRPVPEAAGLRVLLVDDNIDLLESMEIILRASGFTVAVALGSDEALKMVEDFRPMIAVLDLGLPVMDGYELANELRRSLPSQFPRIIALSGYGQPSDRERSLAAGFEEHLVKPIDFEELIRALLACR